MMYHIFILISLDIDECTTGALQCDYGCENTPGSAHCLCPEGYTVQNISTCIGTNITHQIF